MASARVGSPMYSIQFFIGTWVAMIVEEID